MWQDVGIAEWQKQGGDYHIKQLSIQAPTYLFSLHAYYGKRSLYGGCVRERSSVPYLGMAMEILNLP